MANPDSVAQYYLDSFGNGRLGVVQATQLNTAGNAVIAIPFLNGGLTKGSSAVSSGSVIIRRITVNNPSGSVASANVSITTSNDGNTSNAVVASVASFMVPFPIINLVAGAAAGAGPAQPGAHRRTAPHAGRGRRVRRRPAGRTDHRPAAGRHRGRVRRPRRRVH